MEKIFHDVTSVPVSFRMVDDRNMRCTLHFPWFAVEYGLYYNGKSWEAGWDDKELDPYLEDINFFLRSVL